MLMFFMSPQVICIRFSLRDRDVLSKIYFLTTSFPSLFPEHIILGDVVNRPYIISTGIAIRRGERYALISLDINKPTP